MEDGVLHLARIWQIKEGESTASAHEYTDAVKNEYFPSREEQQRGEAFFFFKHHDSVITLLFHSFMPTFFLPLMSVLFIPLELEIW